MNLFFTTLLVTFPLFVCAAVLFNYCRRRVGKSGSHPAGGCSQGGNGTGCSCSATVQTIIQSADKIR